MNTNEIVGDKWNGKEVWDELERIVRNRQEDGMKVGGWEVPTEVWPAEGVVPATDASEIEIDGVEVKELDKAGESQAEEKKENYPLVDAERKEQHDLSASIPNPATPTASPAAADSPGTIYHTPEGYRGNPNPSAIYDAPGVPGTIEISKKLRIMPALVEGRDVDLDTPTPSQREVPT